MNISISSASSDEAEDIASLLDIYAKKQIVLSRTPQDILQYLENFITAHDEQGRLVGCVALRDFGNGLNEIRSLAVLEDCQGQRLGARLVEAAVKLAHQRNATRIYALTLRPRFFEFQGFFRCRIDDFPEKLRADCQACPKRDHCDEIVMKYGKEEK